MKSSEDYARKAEGATDDAVTYALGTPERSRAYAAKADVYARLAHTAALKEIAELQVLASKTSQGKHTS